MRLVCSNNNQNIGIVKRNTNKHFSFDLYNNSSRVTPFDVYPGCGCTGVNPIKEVLLPFEHTQINVNFDPNKNALGEWEKLITVSYIDDLDNNQQKDLSLTFNVNVIV